MSVFRKIDRMFSVLLTNINALSALMIFGLMLIITTDVIARSIFNSPIQGVAEIVSNAIIILCFMQIPYVLMEGTHLRSTLIYDKLGIKGKSVIDLVACILGAFVFAFILYSSIPGFIRAVAIGDAELAGTLRISTIPGRFSILLGSALMIIEFVFLAIKNIIRLINPSLLEEKKPQESTPPKAPAKEEGGNTE